MLITGHSPSGIAHTHINPCFSVVSTAGGAVPGAGGTQPRAAAGRHPRLHGRHRRRPRGLRAGSRARRRRRAAAYRALPRCAARTRPGADGAPRAHAPLPASGPNCTAPLRSAARHTRRCPRHSTLRSFVDAARRAHRAARRLLRALHRVVSFLIYY